MRIVSLVPSVTETLTAWGREPVACTRFCERSDLPNVGGTKDPDVAQVVDLAPDLVVVDAEENRREDFEELVSAGVPVHVLHIQSLQDIDDQMSVLSDRVGGSWRSIERPEVPQPRVRAFIPIWRKPWMALGSPSYGSSILEHLGVANVCAEAGRYPEVSLEAAASKRPDVVLAPSEPYPFSVRQLDELVSVAPTTFVDGKDLFWWGTRTAEALDRLGEVIAGL
jgi:ABC-type Fe3+-hydroxamate transport system substrate-binding protein